MTNGEKLVKVFPDIELYKKMHGGIQIDFDSTWWNAEYKEPSTKINQDFNQDSTKIAVEEFANKILNAMDFSIKVTDSKDAYGVGMRNGIRYCKSLIDNKEPEFENVPENNVGEIEPTKNNLAVDKAKKESELIARGDVINMIKEIAKYHTGDSFNADRLIRNIKELPPATPQLSSGLEKNSKKLENASPIIDWNNCHTSEQIDSITTTKDDLAVDCISRAEAIKCLECDFNITSKENMKTVVNYINSAHDKIVNLPSVTPQEPRWIPVSERLPEKNMRCLVAVGRFNFTEIATYSDLMGIIDHKIFYQGDVGHDNFKNITQYVKAWMPLLKSYKAESENKG